MAKKYIIALGRHQIRSSHNSDLVHICHEFMHYIGYCHTGHKDDVMEAIGEIAYFIMEKKLI